MFKWPDEVKDDEYLELMCSLHDPQCLIESLMTKNMSAPYMWGLDSEEISVYNYQLPMLNYAMMYCEDYELSPELNFKIKVDAGTCYNIAARNVGKSDIFIVADAICDPIWLEGSQALLASFCEEKLNKIANKIAKFIEFHPFFKAFALDGQQSSSSRGHDFRIESKNGYICIGANEQVGTPKEGNSFHGPHPKLTRYEEYSYAGEKGEKKRIDSIHPYGNIERFSGIADIRVGSPLGKVLYDESKKPWIMNFPQFVREDWSDAERLDKIKKFNGESSNDYKLNVVGEYVEGTDGVFDLKRIREKCLNTEKHIKTIEINKDTFINYETILKSVERVPCEQVYIASDIGTTGSPSEIIIVFCNIEEDKKYFKYRYNIPLFNLTTQEQAKIFKFLYDKLEGAIISLDATTEGRSIADELVILGVPNNNIVRCMFNAKMVVDFEYEDAEKSVLKLDSNGNPIEKTEKQIDWAVKQLCDIFYDGRIDLLYDGKLLKELGGYTKIITGLTYKYKSKTSDHILQSFQCLALAQFIVGFNTTLSSNTKKRKLGIIK